MMLPLTRWARILPQQTHKWGKRAYVRLLGKDVSPTENACVSTYTTGATQLQAIRYSFRHSVMFTEWWVCKRQTSTITSRLVS